MTTHETLEVIKNHALNRLHDIAKELDDDDGFMCSDQLHDAKNCVSLLHKIAMVDLIK